MEVSWLHLLPLLPLLGAAVCGIAGRWLPKSWVTTAALGSILLSFLLGFSGFMGLTNQAGTVGFHENAFHWFAVGKLTVEMGFFFDRLSGTLVLVITGVGFLIHLYSAAYMEDDKSYHRYFAYLNLFVAAMLVLVLGDNLVAMFVGWEGVGLCSYLLIGFWFDDDAKAFAGRKAFVVNRIGDFGFLLGIFVLFNATGTVDFHELASKNNLPLITASLAAAFLFLGAAGKSAQLPLYIWLPDAMAGPTPVSALIHAATMVTAGVYMICRLSGLYVQAPGIMALVAIIGTLTALWSALIATTQTDIKKALAYSTVSQLGYMFVGVGVGAFFAGSMHLVTHAFFKACLFLGSGSVIMGMHHEQDMRKMGGLKKLMPHTAMTFWIATVAISGIIPISGFFSKDEILAQAANTGVFSQLDLWPPALHPFGMIAPKLTFLGPTLYFIGCFTALLTSFYMWRCYNMTFEGSYRGPADHHPHESPPAMTLPLWILAALSIVGLVLGLPESWGHALHLESFSWENFTHEVFAEPRGHEGHWLNHYVGYGIALAIGWGGWFIARLNYVTAPERTDAFVAAWPRLYKTLLNKIYVDEFYDFLINRPLWKFAKGLWAIVDRVLIDGLLVNGPAQLVAFVGSLARRFQNGDVQRYAAVTAFGVAALVWVLLR